MLGIKCTWCTLLKQYDILIDHQGGENISLEDLRFVITTDSNDQYLFNANSPFFSVYDPAGSPDSYKPPESCDGSSTSCSDPSCKVFSSGKSIKYSFKPAYSGDYPPNISFLSIEEPTTIGFAPISRLNVNYIQNLSQHSTIKGVGGQYDPVSGYSVTPDIIRSTLVYSPSGCEVEFVYRNDGEDTYYGWGSQGQPYNYIAVADGSNVLDVTFDPSFDSSHSRFPHSSGFSPIMKVKFLGLIDYRLGGTSVPVNCDERVINYLKRV